MMKNRTRCTKT